MSAKFAVFRCQQGQRKIAFSLLRTAGSTMTRIHLAAIALSLTLLAVRTLAQTPLSPPPGWTRQAVGKAIVLSSPANNSDSGVQLAILPPGHPRGEVKSWFGNQALALAGTLGRALTGTDVMEQEGILVRVVEIENAKRGSMRAAFYGYPTSTAFTMTVLMTPMGVADEDPRLEAAHQYIKQLAATKFELVLAAPAPPPQYVGQFGRSDIDLTYHPKAVIPRDRDVPLKGVYLFVGFAFGPSYGGVGTTMTWGQKATQQLLLLFANGVATKTDLRGGNLAGKYQAEGFATMDVSNPAVVSGAPFGRWTEDANAIQIRWNVGAPTQLMKNGPNLERQGERWTPYHLADGITVSGTFLRDMGPGLRSQSIVLREDGTFMGDGVNVTMGGSMVSPAFPERGSGTYEIHKGSMILYFSNGFTQAIACVLDQSNAGGVKTVLLNGFPFERVR